MPGRVPSGRTRCARPDAGDERQRKVTDEVVVEAFPDKELTPRQVGVGRATGQHSTGGTVEPWDLRGQPEKAGRHDVARLGEEPAWALATAVLEPAAVAADAERHLALLADDAELVEQPAQRRIGALVEDDETAVDGPIDAIGEADAMGVGVATPTIVGLEQCDVVRAGHDVRRRQARDAAANDGDRGTIGGPGGARHTGRVRTRLVVGWNPQTQNLGRAEA